MKRNISLTCCLATLAFAAAAPAFADAAIPTTTTGNVCCPHVAGQLENYGGYVFKGRTSPSLTGQYVYFQYKRRSWTRWRPFNVADNFTNFFVLKKSAPRDQINDRDRWRVSFMLAVRQGHWKVRAVFPSQGGYARSEVVKKYWVRQPD